MPHFNLPELAIVLVIVVVLFGRGRVGQLGGEVGTAIREFRKGISGDEPSKPTDVPVIDPTQIPPAAR